MSYIERKTALKFVRNNTPHINGETTMKCVARAIKEVPTADVVAVVRCKDCSYADIMPSGLYRCRLHSVYSMFGNSIFNVTPEDYCSRGERRTDDEG